MRGRGDGITVEQMRDGYDWLCKRIYSTPQTASRAWREMPGKLVSSIISDLG